MLNVEKTVKKDTSGSSSIVIAARTSEKSFECDRFVAFLSLLCFDKIDFPPIARV